MAKAAPALQRPGSQERRSYKGTDRYSAAGRAGCRSSSQRLGVPLAVVIMWFAVASAAGALASHEESIHPSRARPFSAPHQQDPLLEGSPLSWLPSQPVDPTDHLSHARNAFLVAEATDSAAAVHLHLVWEQDNRIRYARGDERGWQVETRFAPPGDSPAIAIGPDGRLHLVYTDVSADGDQLQVRYCVRDAEGWGLPQVIDERRPSSDNPTIALVDDDVHVVWTERLDTHNQLVHARSTNRGQLWESVRPIPDAWGYAPALAAAPDGSLWLSWQSESDARTGQASDIHVSRWDGVCWSAPEDVSQTPMTYSRAPDLLCTGLDEAHITWEEESVDGSLGVYYGARGASGWSAPTLLSQDDGSQPCIAHSAHAGVHVAWDAGQSVHLRSRLGAGSWGDLTPVASAADGIRDVALAADREGRLWAVWSARMETGVWSLFFSSEAPEATVTPSCSPTTSKTPTPTPSPTVTPMPTDATAISPVPSATALASSTMTAPTWNPTPMSVTPSASGRSEIHLPVAFKWGGARPGTSPRFQPKTSALSAAKVGLGPPRQCLTELRDGPRASPGPQGGWSGVCGLGRAVSGL
jgi:hypothetical protein